MVIGGLGGQKFKLGLFAPSRLFYARDSPQLELARVVSGGLAVAKRGIESTDGCIWFETMDGEGTTFFVELPLAE